MPYIRGLSPQVFLREFFKLFLNNWKMTNYTQCALSLLKVNSRNTRTKCEICSKLTIKTPERCYWCRSDIFIVNFEHFTPCSSVSIVNIEHVIAGWQCAFKILRTTRYLIGS